MLSEHGFLHYSSLPDHLPHIVGICHELLHHELHLQLLYLVCHISDSAQFLFGFQKILVGLHLLFPQRWGIG